MTPIPPPRTKPRLKGSTYVAAIIPLLIPLNMPVSIEGIMISNTPNNGIKIRNTNTCKTIPIHIPKSMLNNIFQPVPTIQKVHNPVKPPMIVAVKKSPILKYISFLH
jgi:hypothetical protein